MRKFRSIVVLIKLVTLSLVVSSNLIHGLADEDYQVTATLQAVEPKSHADFGYSVIVSGDIIVVGEWFSEVDGNHQAGRVYIFDSTGKLKVSLTAPTPKPFARFGRSVAAGGDMLVVGEHHARVDGKRESGQIHIFDYNGNLHTTLQSPEPDAYAIFGRCVTLSEDIVVVSEPGADVDGVYSAGRVHLYDLNGTLFLTLTSPEPLAGASFGYTGLVGEEGVIVVGEIYSPVEEKVAAGKVHIFDSDGNLKVTLQSPEPQTEGYFGFSVAVGGNIVVIGEYRSEVEGTSKAGKAHLFDLDGNFIGTLQSPEPEDTAMFGYSVATDGELIVVGEIGADGESEDEGRAYVFNSEGLLATLVSLEPHSDAEFGASVAIGGDFVVVGETQANVGDTPMAGRAYIYRTGMAKFTTTGIMVDPSMVEKGGTVTISCEVNNVGEITGSHTVTLMIDGEVEDEKTVTLNPDKSETVSFQVSAAEQGSYSVEVDGLTGSYTVTEPKKEPSFWDRIPGFPYMAVILGLMTGIFMIWLLQRRH